MESKKEEKSTSNTRGDLEVNNLIYKQPNALSLAVSRKLCRQYFQRSDYKEGESATIIWNTGSTYINPHNSYLTFKVDLLGGGSVNFGAGSAINLLNSITVTSRSGTELDRIERLNLWAAKEIRNSYSHDWITKYGSMMGLGETGDSASDPAVVTFGTKTRFVIPLNLISGFFHPTSDQLIPPMLASGLRIEFKLEDHRIAFTEKTVGVTGYEISDISIQTDCVDLSDDSQKTLNMEAASSGLEYTYPRTETFIQPITTANGDIQLRKAVSQALTVAASIQDMTPGVSTDYMASEFWNVTKWQYRLGSLYFPNQPISDAKDGVESFFVSQETYDKCKQYNFHCDNAVSLDDFVSGGYGLMTASLEKDQDLNLSGLPINNSRQLNLNYELDSVVGTHVFGYLKYMSVAKAFIDNVAVSI